MSTDDLEATEKIANFRLVCQQVEKHLLKNLNLQGHIQINFFSGYASNWSVLQSFQTNKLTKNLRNFQKLRLTTRKPDV